MPLSGRAGEPLRTCQIGVWEGFSFPNPQASIPPVNHGSRGVPFPSFPVLRIPAARSDSVRMRWGAGRSSGLECRSEAVYVPVCREICPGGWHFYTYSTNEREVWMDRWDGRFGVKKRGRVGQHISSDTFKIDIEKGGEMR